MCFLAAFEKNEFRKPQKGMFNHYVKEVLNLTTIKDKIDWRESFYCGDAAGRKHPNKDFSSDDMLFAVNIGLKFYTPEMFFLGSNLNFEPIVNCKLDVKYLEPQVQSKTEEEHKNSDSKHIEQYKDLGNPRSQVVLIFVGSPGSGKSTFFREYLCDNFKRINNDTIKNPKKAIALTKEMLRSGHNIVIDNLNASEGVRQTYIELAKEAGVKTIKCLYFETPKETCLSNNELRKINGGYKHMSSNVSKVVIHSFVKNHVEPKL
jgi:bifunctional polynucleotide phosphatase/kinase